MKYVYRGAVKDDPSTGTCRDGNGGTGSIRGYGRHVRRNEKPCGKCRDAMNAYQRAHRKEWESKNPATKSADRMRRKARARAWAALATNHKKEFAALLLRELATLHAEMEDAP